MKPDRKPGHPARLLSAFLILAVQASLAPVPAAGPSTIFGTVVSGERRVPVPAARVHMGDAAGRAIVASAETGPDGRYTLGGQAAGTYRLAVEAGGGLFLVEAPLVLAAGEERRVNLALPSRTAGAAPATVREAGGLWANPLLATFVVVGSALVIGAAVESATDDDEEPASAF